jgi:protein-disulfide isomerase
LVPLLVVAVIAGAAVGIELLRPSTIEATGHSATRAFSDTSVLPGGQLEVTITAADYGGFGRVDETLPDGFTFVSSTLDAEVGAVTVEDQVVKFRLFGDDEFTYTVTATTTPDDYTFSGVLRDDNAEARDIGGESIVTVEAEAVTTPDATSTPTSSPVPMPTGPRASRSFSDTSVLPGGQLEVTITAADYGGFGRVDETLPDGFGFVSSTLDSEEGAVTEDGQVVKFRLLGDDEFTYTVTATTTPDDYTFSGVLRDDNAEARDIGGESIVTVEAEAVTTPDATSTPTSSPVPMPTGPRASRSFSDTSVLPGGQLEVTITAADYGGFGRVDETLPDGFTFVSSTLDAEVGAVTVEDQVVKFRLSAS